MTIKSSSVGRAASPSSRITNPAYMASRLAQLPKWQDSALLIIHFSNYVYPDGSAGPAKLELSKKLFVLTSIEFTLD